MAGAGATVVIAVWRVFFFYSKHRGNGSKTVASAGAKGHSKLPSKNEIQPKNFNK